MNFPSFLLNGNSISRPLNVPPSSDFVGLIYNTREEVRCDHNSSPSFANPCIHIDYYGIKSILSYLPYPPDYPSILVDGIQQGGLVSSLCRGRIYSYSLPHSHVIQFGSFFEPLSPTNSVGSDIDLL